MLRFLLDLNPKQEICVSEMAKSFSADKTTGVSENLPELQLIAEKKELLNRQIGTVKSSYFPSIFLFGQLGANGYQDSFKGFFNDYRHHWFGNSFLGIKVNIPIFDANSKKKKIKGYRYELAQTDLMLEERRKALARDFDNTIQKLELDLSSFQTQKDNYSQALSVYNVTEERYEGGMASMTDLLQDEMRMRQSQISCVHTALPVR